MPSSRPSRALNFAAFFIGLAVLAWVASGFAGPGQKGTIVG